MPHTRCLYKPTAQNILTCSFLIRHADHVELLALNNLSASLYFMSLSPVADKTQQQVKRIFIPAHTGGNLVPGHCTHVSPVPGAFSPHLMRVSVHFP